MDLQSRGGEPNSSNRSRSGFGSQRVWWMSFAASIAIHVLVIAIYPFFQNTVNVDSISFSLPNISGRVEGIQVLRLIEETGPIDTERPDDPEEIESIDEPEPGWI